MLDGDQRSHDAEGTRLDLLRALRSDPALGRFPFVLVSAVVGRSGSPVAAALAAVEADLRRWPPGQHAATEEHERAVPQRE